MLVDKMNSLLKIFNGTDMLIAAHCEDQEIIKANIEKYKTKYQGADEIPVNAHPGIRSVQACYTSSDLAIRLARIAGARLHILHVSTAKELRLFSDEPLEDKNITSEACVAHLLFHYLTTTVWAHASSVILPSNEKRTGKLCGRLSIPD